MWWPGGAENSALKMFFSSENSDPKGFILSSYSKVAFSSEYKCSEVFFSSEYHAPKAFILFSIIP